VSSHHDEVGSYVIQLEGDGNVRQREQRVEGLSAVRVVTAWCNAVELNRWYVGNIEHCE